MQASRVTIDEKTYDLNVMTRKKKTALRRRLIVEYIESKPAGAIIKMQEFQKLCHFSTYANTHTFIKRMIRDDVIRQVPAEGYKSRFTYVIVDRPEPKPQPKPAVHVAPSAPIADINLYANIERLAKEFAWEQNSDSVREFVPYLKGRI